MEKIKILVVDDQSYERDSICALLADEGCFVKGVSGGAEAVQELKQGDFQLVVTDLKMPGMDGTEVARKIRDVSPLTLVIVVTAYAEVKTAVEAMRCGAFDYIMKGATFPEELLECVSRAMHTIGSLKKADEAVCVIPQIVGESPAMKKVMELARIAAEKAECKYPALIFGESGTGKELLARAIHLWSPRRNKPFIAINCAAIPDSLAESELLGIEEGVATGVKKRIGKFEQANGGTLFLDEIGDLKLELQAKLLRVTQEYEFERVGGNKNIKVDVRIISATSVDLQKGIAAGKFKEALLYRLNTFEIKLPPLRERREDIPRLIEHFISRHTDGDGRGSSLTTHTNKKIRPEAVSALTAYEWPGNVRQLEKVILRSILLSGGDAIRKEHLPSEIIVQSKAAGHPDSIPDMERDMILRVLQETQYNLHEAARRLKISRPTLYSKMKRFGIDFSYPQP